MVSQPDTLSNPTFLTMAMPPPGFSIGGMIKQGIKVGELGWDGAVSVYDAGADAAQWTGDQLGHAADATWDGTKWVANKTVDASMWVGEQVVDGGEWIWDGTKYVLIKTRDTGVFVWDESVKGGRWVYKKGEAAAEWIALHYQLEKVCGSKGEPGPGSGPSGTGTPEYPKPGYQPLLTQDGVYLELARAWMPYIQMSKDEKCGEIKRVIAKVLPYRDNTLINNLEDADRVEIVYTLVFSHDGGRWYGGVHPGDNEGFVVGLLPTNQTTGRCNATTPHFQFYGGRTVKHKDVPLKEDLGTILGTGAETVVKWAGFEKEIEDFNLQDLGASCPGTNDPSYSLWVAESKHATYFSQHVCEETMLGWEVAGIILGGLEECEGGRPLSDLRSRIEIWNASMDNEPSPIHGKSYSDVTRGDGNNPSDLYHVPNLECPGFDTASAIPIRFTEIPDESQWTVTVIGMDDFDPMVGVSGDPLFCNDDSDTASAYSVSGIPGYGNFSGSRRSAQINFKVVDGGDRTFYVDSRDKKPGAFVFILESSDGGMGISPAGDKDNLFVWGMNGGDMGVYVVSEGGDLDPTLFNPASNLSSDNESAMTGFSMSTSLQTYTGHSTDAFLNMDLGGASAEREFVIGASNNTTGRYAVVIVNGNIPIEGLPPAPTIPVVQSVSGPTSITADGQNHDFTVSFSDSGGDINRIVINSVNNTWGTIDFNPMGNLKSGDGYAGTTTFAYNCTTGSNSFSDTLQITLYDAAGNASQPYTHPLACVAQPPKTYAPVIASVDGPSTIIADSGRQYFWVNFTDSDGDASRLVVNSDKGKWDAIEVGPPLPVESGNLYGGMVGFYYSCTASKSFSDTVRVKLYDVAGNVSNTYSFELKCERQVVMPPQRFAPHISLSITGGHGSSHKVGETIQFCYTFTGVGQIGPEGAGYKFAFLDYQPATPGPDGVDTSGPHQVHASGWAGEGTYCTEGKITVPKGLEAFRVELLRYDQTHDWMVEFAEIWILVK
jgi:hypothetical protein